MVVSYLEFCGKVALFRSLILVLFGSLMFTTVKLMVKVCCLL
jgi:hypothetical protein